MSDPTLYMDNQFFLDFLKKVLYSVLLNLELSNLSLAHKPKSYLPTFSKERKYLSIFL